jgi:hypothetical protein
MAEIIIEIDEEGRITTEGTGFVGRTCLQEMAEIEQLLGGKVSEKLKPEALQAAPAREVQRARR